MLLNALIQPLTDGMFKGIYHGKQCHVADIAAVLSRAWSAGVDRIIVISCCLIFFFLGGKTCEKRIVSVFDYLRLLGNWNFLGRTGKLRFLILFSWQPNNR